MRNKSVSARVRLEDWMEVFESRREIGPDCALYSYRCTGQEFEELTALLKEVVPCGFLPLSKLICAGFCLFVAEWWRRDYEGQGWSWACIFKRLEQPSTPRLTILYDVIVCGMRHWQRPIRRSTAGRMFLATLAIEGGLPLSLLRTQGTHLRRYFRHLMEDLSTYRYSSTDDDVQLARRHQGCLPKSFRETEVYELTASITRLVLTWQAQMNWDGRGDALDALERAIPSWRLEFPLNLDDSVALALLKGLVKDASEVVRRPVQPLKLQTTLCSSGSGVWSLHRTAQLPAAIDADRLAQAFELEPSSLPTRFLLRACDGHEVLHSLAIVTALSGQRFRLQSISDKDLALSDDVLIDALELHMTVGFETRCTTVPMGWETLEEEPWLFEEKDTGRYRLVGQGSVSTPSGEGVVAVTSTTTLEALSSADHVKYIAELSAVGRSLYRISGQVRWMDRHSDEEGLLRTGFEASEVTSYQLHGRRLKHTPRRQQVFLGHPRLRVIAEASPIKTLPASSLQWRPGRSRSLWKPISSHCVGDVQLRLREDERTLFRTRAMILPEQTTIRLKPGKVAPHGNKHEGCLLVDGLGAQHVTVKVPQSIEVTQTRSSYGQDIFELVAGRQVPQSLELCAIWSHGNEARVTLPFPAATACFTNLASGRVLGPGERLHWRAINTIRARATSPEIRDHFAISAQLIGGTDLDSQTRKQTSFFAHLQPIDDHHQLDLIRVGARIDRMLTLTTNPDVRVEVKLKDHQGRVRHVIALTRFVGEIHPVATDDGESLFALMEDSEREVNEALCGPLRVEALALWDPDGQSRQVLTQVDGNRWRLPVENMAAGSWLVVAWEGQASRFRPRVVIVPSQEGVEQSARTPLQRVSFIKSRGRRLREFRQLIAASLQNPADSVWSEMAHYIQAVNDLPPELFDVVDCLIAQPRALALVMAKLKLEDFSTLWSTLEQTPMDWTLMPISAWFQAFKAQADILEPSCRAAGFDPWPMMEALLGPYLQHMSTHTPGFDMVEVFLAHHLYRADMRGTPVSLASDSSMHPLLINVRQDENKALLSRQANTPQWPDDPTSLLEWAAALQSILASHYGDAVVPLMKTLWLQANLSHRSFVFNIPMLAALSNILGQTPTKQQVLMVRQVRDFDPDWFKIAYETALTLFLGNMPELVCGDQP